jgi:pyruvate,water dikinase
VSEYVISFDQLGMKDLEKVGGKNASLGEMISNLAASGVSVPMGFATTAEAYQEFLQADGLDQRIHAILDDLDVENVLELADSGKKIRQMVLDQPLPETMEKVFRVAIDEIQAGDPEASFAVRSSATAEDLPDASFAGQQETFLNIQGTDNIIHAVKEVFASLFNDRAIAYREHKGFDHKSVLLSAGIQKMVNSAEGASGVMFTLDTESGFEKVVFITSSWGLGENVVQGTVNPDEFYVYKPAIEAGRPSVLRRNLGSKKTRMVYDDAQVVGRSVKTEDVPLHLRNQFSISDADAESLARMAMTIEAHYGRPMDIEWGKDGRTGDLYILQARPETVQSQSGAVRVTYRLTQKPGQILVEGRSIGHRIGSGKARVVSSIEDMHRVQPGDVLIADMTDPDWEPVMKRAAAIVTNRGGRTCHAAIIARELGIPAVVGTHDATDLIKDGDEVTVSCAEGDTGFVYKGLTDFEQIESSVDEMPDVPVKIMMNVGNPDRAFAFQSIPNFGIGLARLEFIINRMIGVHPKALLNFDRLPPDLKKEVEGRISGYDNPVEFYVAKLTEGIATLAAAFAPKKVIVRLSDFKSNEYANLLGGQHYEPHEENPMIGFRGVSRYLSHSFEDCFELECQAVKRVREDMGLDNVEVMVPFVRTPREASEVIDLLGKNGLKRGENGLRIIMMCELPSNALLADDFLQYFDGFSIGSNDLTQLTLGLDRDSGVISHLFDERNPAVKMLLAMAIKACKAQGKYVGICGQGPSDHEDLARWLMDQGIDTISLNPDTVTDTWFFLAGEGEG